MFIHNIYRNIIPIGVRYKIANRRLGKRYKALVRRMKADYDKDDYDESVKKEIEYILLSGEYNVIPYEWVEDYQKMEIRIEKDKACNMHYVMHNGKRLYFPAKYTPDFIEPYYKSLLIEQDKRSPHKYFSKIDIYTDTIFVDIGAAEGIISLDIIDHVDKVIMLECNREWKEALEKTFENYKQKVEIIPKFAGSRDCENICKIDTLLGDKKYLGYEFILKMDVEGSELEVLSGSEYILFNRLAAAYVCTYHNEEDFALITDYLKKFDYEIQQTDGYMLICSDDGDYSFRRGLVRIEKVLKR